MDAVTGRRAQNRVERTRLFLDTALAIVTNEGFDALTMGRLAEECGSAIGAVYRYFPSKGALMAEVQREAIERLRLSYAATRERIEPHFEVVSAADAALARLVLLGRWFVATNHTQSQELHLLQMLMSESRPVIPIEESSRVLPEALLLLDEARRRLAEATAEGVLDDRVDTMSRVIVWAAAVGGALQTGRLGIYEGGMVEVARTRSAPGLLTEGLLDGERLSRELTDDLFCAWGAGRDQITLAVKRVADHWDR